MEVIYFHRQEGAYNSSYPSRSDVSFVTGIYVTSEDIALCTEAHGTSPAFGPVLTDNKDLLEELRLLKDGKVPDKLGVKYDTWKAEVDEEKIEKLIEDAKKLKEMEPVYGLLLSNLNSGYRELKLVIEKEGKQIL